MRKYLLLCGLFCVALWWGEPYLRTARETMPWLRWLPAYDAVFWGYLGVALVVGAVVTGLIFLVKAALYLWREVVD